MSVRILAVACVVAAVVVGCGRPPANVGTSTPQPPGSSTAAFAFTTASQLGLVRNGAVAATVTSAAQPRYPVFTDGGKYVAAADGSQIVAVGFAANSARTIPSNAERVFAGGADTIAWWEAPDLVSLDLSTPSSAPVKKHIDLPGGTTGQTRLISLANGIAVFARPGGAPDSPDDLVTMGRDQQFHPLGPAPDKQPIHTGFASRDGRKFAYASAIRAACPKDAVGVVDTDTGAVTSPPMPYSLDNGATTRAIWWDKDGLLHISIAEKPCGAGDVVTSTRTWKLDQGKWIQDGSEPTLVSRQLDGNAVALVEPAVPKPPAGTLFVVTDQRRDHIADNVTDLAAPTVSSSNAS
jgi:hypothetical protein